MKAKSKKKQKPSVAMIIVETASSDLPLTAFLSLFTGYEQDGFGQKVIMEMDGISQCEK
jgi:hypothetical protein